MKYVIIGTAGHVDHGKTALIKALTGCDTDRLKEEKARGISIDLGFASLQLGAEILAGIVDVPGHERFLKNMLAGTGAIDMAMLVIAADEGVMPQTREHLAMLNLYGVKHGVVVVTKIDKVDQDWLELIEDDIRSLLAGTYLETAPLCRVSAVSGAGLTELQAALQAIAAGINARDRAAPFRMWVDRAFLVKGHGVVVTGSVLSGQAGPADTLLMMPAARIVKIRGLECHGSKINSIYAGQRAAINLAGVELEKIGRGMFLSHPGRGQVSLIWDVWVNCQQAVPNGARVRLHLGTGEYIARLYDCKAAAGQYKKLHFEQPVAGGAGDKGILRLYSPQRLLGGAMLVMAGGRGKKVSSARVNLAKALSSGSTNNIVYSILDELATVTSIETIQKYAGYISNKELQSSLAVLTAGGTLQELGGYYIVTEHLGQITDRMKKQLASYHGEQPERAGLSKELLRQRLGLGEKEFQLLIDRWLTDQLLTVSGGEVATKEHAAKHGDWKQGLTVRAMEVLDDAGLLAIDSACLAKKMNLSQDQARTAHELLIKAGLLVKVGDIYVYRKTIQYTAKLIQAHFQQNATLSVGEIRDMLNITRKLAIPLLEYFDMHKYTIRDGDSRRAGPKLKDLSE